MSAIQKILISGLVAILLLLLSVYAMQRHTTFISAQEARLRVEHLREVSPYLQSNHVILELDRGPTSEDPYYHFWLTMKEVPPEASSGTIGWYAVDPYTGKVYSEP